MMVITAVFCLFYLAIVCKEMGVKRSEDVMGID